MIVSSQTQKADPKLGRPTAQDLKASAQVAPQAFNLLLTMLNNQGGSGEETGEIATDAANEAFGAVEQTPEPLADPNTLAAKIADWLGANPANLSALQGLAATSTGLSTDLTLGQSMNPSVQQFANAAPLLGLQENSNLQSPAANPTSAVAGVAAIERAAMQVSADLVTAVLTPIDLATADPKSSNQLLASSLFGNLSLADALSTAVVTDGLSSGNQPLALSFDNLKDPMRNVGVVVTSAHQGNTPLSVALGGERLFSSLVMDQSENGEQIAAEELRHHQLQAGDALLQVPAFDRAVGSNSLQQAMSNQVLSTAAAISNASALEGTVSWLGSQQGGSATIDLTPPELGSVRLELKIDAAGEGAILVVHAASDAARAAIEQSLDRLYESFQASGMTLHVSVGGGSSGSAQSFKSGSDLDPLSAGDLRMPAEIRLDPTVAASRASMKSSDVLNLYA
ncbi:MAG: flagellar hook-length control protein FliK [Betaproteobacteria bacterium]|nr:flagellar hook-length control protein FliK [Betaproteobacteria bacterium]